MGKRLAAITGDATTIDPQVGRIGDDHGSSRD
jgi:hypothetical protein